MSACPHQDGQTALIEAASRGKADVVVELLKAGAQVDQKNKVFSYVCGMRIILHMTLHRKGNLH